MGGVSQLLKDLGHMKMVVIGFMAMLLLGGVVLLSVKLSQPAMSPLFSGMDPKDSAAVTSKLDLMGVPYEIKNNGGQILVPSDRALQLRVTMAKEGLPNGGSVVGYEIFDKSDSLGSSSFVNNVNLLRALEGELGRTIGAFASIESARVHLVVPRRDLFSRKKQEPTASVVLDMKGNEPLGKSEIGAISHLVATAVPGLTVQKITIVDTQGRPFKLGANDENDPGIFATTTESFRVQYESRLKRTLEELVGRTVGLGQVEAQVSADIDFDRTVTNSEVYDPDGQVARSIQSTEEREVSSENAGGEVGVENSFQPEGGAGSSSNVERVDEVTNFEISKTIKNHISETGTIQKLSIAILVDGTYEFDEETEEQVYTPRSQEELDKITELVKSAVGYDEERGDKLTVVNMRFSNKIQGVETERPFDWIKRDFGNIIQTVVIGVVVILIILLIVKPMVNRAFEFSRAENEESDLQVALAGGVEGVDPDLVADIEGIGGEKSDSIIDLDKFEEKMNSSSVGAINDIVKKHPEETVSIIRNWIERGSG